MSDSLEREKSTKQRTATENRYRWRHKQVRELVLGRCHKQAPRESPAASAADVLLRVRTLCSTFSDQRTLMTAEYASLWLCNLNVLYIVYHHQTVERAVTWNILISTNQALCTYSNVRAYVRTYLPILKQNRWFYHFRFIYFSNTCTSIMQRTGLRNNSI